MQNGVIEEMVSKELETKEANLGFDTKQLYVRLAKTVLKKTRFGFLAWRPIAWIVRKIFGTPESIVQSIVDKATGSMADESGYTPALYTVVCDQLDEIWEKLKTGGNQENSIEISDTKKSQLTGLVKNLLDVLRRTKCQTIDDLKKVVNNTSFSETIKGTLEGFILQDVLEKVTTILASTTQSLIGADPLNKLTYKFASIANRAFEGKSPSQSEETQGKHLKTPHEMELKIAQRTEQILRFAVNAAVKKKFDSFSGEKQQTQTNAIITDLHARSLEYTTTINTHLQELASMDLRSANAQNKIDTILEITHAYQAKCNTCCHEARAANINSDNRDDIHQRYLGIAEQSKPLVEAISAIKKRVSAMGNYQSSLEEIEKVVGMTTDISTSAFQSGQELSLQNIEQAEAEVVKLHSCIVSLGKISHLEQEAKKIDAENKKIAVILTDLQKAVKTRSCANDLEGSNSLIAQIVAERKQNLNQPQTPTLKKKFTELRAAILLNMEPVSAQKLIRSLETLEKARIEQEFNLSHKDFVSVLRESIDQANKTITAEQTKGNLCLKSIQEIVQATGIIGSNQAQSATAPIQAAIKAAQESLEIFKTWEAQNIKEIPFITFPFPNTKAFQDWGSEVTYGLIRGRMDGFLKLLQNKETYRSGLLNHLFLIPYNKAH